jgi:predicted nucleotidyltransferase
MGLANAMVSDAINLVIKQKLHEIERQENVCIVFACESGSRAWGFPSADSDYDVRFLYIRPRDWYLSIETLRDVIERPLIENIDLSGWDIRKALQLFRKSNPPLLEWLRSPVIYQENFSVAGKLRELMPTFYSPRNCFYHYLHMAEGNFREYLRGEIVRVKKYFYVLRPLLGCRWIEAGLGPVPMEFGVLIEKVAPTEILKNEIYSLIKRKQSGQELDLEPRIPTIGDFIESELERLKGQAGEQSAVTEQIEGLDDFFRSSLVEVWK